MSQISTNSLLQRSDQPDNLLGLRQTVPGKPGRKEEEKNLEQRFYACFIKGDVKTLAPALSACVGGQYPSLNFGEGWREFLVALYYDRCRHLFQRLLDRAAADAGQRPGTVLIDERCQEVTLEASTGACFSFRYIDSTTLWVEISGRREDMVQLAAIVEAFREHRGVSLGTAPASLAVSLN